jgi:integrase/recombinase XerD
MWHLGFSVEYILEVDLQRRGCEGGSVVKVQRVRFPETPRCSWLVLDDDYRPIEPILSFIKFLHDLNRSPNTIRASAHHLKLFWEFLRDERLDWKEIDIAQLAAFVGWLRRPDPAVFSVETQEAKRTDATIDQILTAIHGFYDFHVRMNAIPELPLYRFLNVPNRSYKPFLHGIAKSKPIQTRVVKVKREQRQVKTLTREQVNQLVDACTRVRDKFLVTLLYESGMRIGQVLGLRHEDLVLEDNEIHIVPRDDNANGARAKTRYAYVIPDVPANLWQLYTDYLVEDLHALEAGLLSDYVFINLWEGEVGRPMTYEAVMSLFRRLGKQTKIHFTPHMLRHTRATQWIREDQLPLPTVSRLLGHANIQTTHAIYVHLTPQDLKKELQENKRKRGKQA